MLDMSMNLNNNWWRPFTSGFRSYKG